MTIAEQIYEEVRTLPEELAREVLDFVSFIEERHALKSAFDRDLQQAQASATSHVWDSNYPPAKPGAFDRWPLKGACSRSEKKRIHGIGTNLAPSQTMGYHAAARSFSVRSHYLLKRIHQIPEMSNFFCPPAEPGVFPG